LPVKIKHLM